MAKRLKLECFAICIIISFFLGGGITRFQQSKILYIFHCFNTTSSVKLFVVTVQIFVYIFFFLGGGITRFQRSKVPTFTRRASH